MSSKQKPKTLEEIVRDLSDDKKYSDAKGKDRRYNAIGLCMDANITDVKVRAGLIDILSQSMVEDPSHTEVPIYRTLPESYFAGVQEYWQKKKEEGSLLFLPKSVFLPDDDLCKYYLDDILPDGQKSFDTPRSTIARSIRTADFLMFILTQYDLLALQPNIVHSVVVELGSALEYLIRTAATSYGRVPENAYDVDLSAEELKIVKTIWPDWGSEIEELQFKDLSLGSFCLDETSGEFKSIDKNYTFKEKVGKKKAKSILVKRQKIKLRDFNCALFEKGNIVLDENEVCSSRTDERIQDYHDWFSYVSDLRNHVHFFSLDQKLHEREEYSNLKITSEMYAFLHVTVEALKLYVKEKSSK